jgi:G patch domain/KOW motif-containing protein
MLYLVSSVVPKKTKAEYIIPMPKKSGWNFNIVTKSGDSGDQVQSQEDKEAAEAIIKDLQQAEADSSGGDSSQFIPMLKQQRLTGATDLATRPEESNLEEYESMPIEHFGAALMRGMGWREGEPIGLTNKQ